VVKRFKDRVKYIYQKNRGLGGARNTGIKNSEGRLIAHLDADDIYLPNYLSQTVSKLTIAGKKTAAVAPNAYLYRQNQPLKRSFYQVYQTPKKITLKSELEGNRLPSSALIKKSVAQKIGLYKETNYLEDHEFWIRLLLNGYQIATLETPLRYYRIYPHSLSVAKEIEFACAYIKLYQELSLIDLNPLLRKIVQKGRANGYSALATGYLLQNQTQKAEKNYQKAEQIYPSLKNRVLLFTSRISPGLTRLLIKSKRFSSLNPQERIKLWSQ